jgi:hypothetical protein
MHFPVWGGLREKKMVHSPVQRGRVCKRLSGEVGGLLGCMWGRQSGGMWSVLERCLVLTETWTTGYNLLRTGDLLIKLDKNWTK